MEVAPAISSPSDLETELNVVTQNAQRRGASPYSWATQISSLLTARRETWPSLELGAVLVDALWHEGAEGAVMPLLDHAMEIHLVAPTAIIAGLIATAPLPPDIAKSSSASTGLRRAIAARRERPALYVKLLQLASTHAMDISPTEEGPAKNAKLAASIHSSGDGGVGGDKGADSSLGLAFVHFLLGLTTALLEATVADWGEEGSLEGEEAMREGGNGDGAGGGAGGGLPHATLGLQALHVVVSLYENATGCKLLTLAWNHLEAGRLRLAAVVGELSLVLNRVGPLLPEGALPMGRRLVALHKQCVGEDRQGLSCPALPMSLGGATWQPRQGSDGPLDLALEEAVEGRRLRREPWSHSLARLVDAQRRLGGGEWVPALLSLWTAAMRAVGRSAGGSPPVSTESCLSAVLSLLPAALLRLNPPPPALLSSLHLLVSFPALLQPPSVRLPLPPDCNLRDLLIRECCARGLLPQPPNLPLCGAVGEEGAVGTAWAQLLEGSPITADLRASLIEEPVQSLPQLQRLREIAEGGGDGSEVSAAAAALCGASLLRSWHLQEHCVALIADLAALPQPHLRPQLLTTLLTCLSEGEAIHIVTMHGRLPHLLLSLMAICEEAGALPHPRPPLFSIALLLFFRCTLAYRLPGKEVGPATVVQLCNQQARKAGQALFCLDSFPRLLAPPVDPAVVEKMMAVVARKPSAALGCEGLSGWDMIGAVSSLGEAVLQACSSSCLTPRDAIKGLKEVLELEPACIGPLSLFLAAEAIRGEWKSVPLNNKDWPSPSANVGLVEQQICSILQQAGVDDRRYFTGGGSDAAPTTTLPLPLALLGSLAISLQQLLEKALPILAVIDPCLERAAASCPPPTIPVLFALEAQQRKTWHAAIVKSAAVQICGRDATTMLYLARHCVSATLPPQAGGGSRKRQREGAEAGAGVGVGVGIGGSVLLKQDGPSPPTLSPGVLFMQAALVMHDPGSVVKQVVRQVVEEGGWGGSRKGEGMERPACQLGCLEPSAAVEGERMCEAAAMGAAILSMVEGEHGVRRLLLEDIRFRWQGGGIASRDGGGGGVLEGQAMARLAVGTLVVVGEGVDAVGMRGQGCLDDFMELVATMMEEEEEVGGGKIRQAMWRGFCITFVGLVVRGWPEWVGAVASELVSRVASGMRRWQEPTLGSVLIQHGGLAAAAAAALGWAAGGGLL